MVAPQIVTPGPGSRSRSCGVRRTLVWRRAARGSRHQSDRGTVAETECSDLERINYDQSLGEARHRAHRAGYLGNLAFVDTCIGMVYQALENAGLLDNTIVVYTSDHGEMGGDHGLFEKMCMFEPSIGVPLIVSYPAKIPQGKVAHALIEQVGLYPTLIELAGGKTSGKIDGKSFASVLMNPGLKGPEAAFCEYALASRGAKFKNRYTRLPEYMVRTHRYKYVYNDGSTHELYDEEADPGEMVNLIDEPAMKATRDDLHDRLFAWYDPLKNPFRASRQEA